jgi:type IV secretion system protein TrbL
MDEQNFFSGGTGPPTFSDMYQYALAAFLYAGVAWSVPSIAGAVMSGAPAMGIGSLMAPIATTAAGTLAATAAGSAVLHGMAARGAQGLEQLSRLTTPETTPGVSGAVSGAEKLATMGTQTQAAGTTTSAPPGTAPSGLESLSAQAHSASGETPAEPPADNPSAASAEGPSAGPGTAGVDALSAPDSSVSNDSSNEPGDADASTARRKRLWRTAQEAGDRFARHASTLAAQAQNMPQTFGALSIRIRHPEG